MVGGGAYTVIYDDHSTHDNPPFRKTTDFDLHVLMGTLHACKQFCVRQPDVPCSSGVDPELFDHILEIAEEPQLKKPLHYLKRKKLYVPDLQTLVEKNVCSMENRHNLFIKTKKIKHLSKCRSDYHRVKFLIDLLERNSDYNIEITTKLKKRFLETNARTSDCSVIHRSVKKGCLRKRLVKKGLFAKAIGINTPC